MSQLKKKFIENNAVDETKIRLSNNAALKARNAANSADVDIVKVNGSDKIEFASVPQVTADASAGNDLVRYSQVQGLIDGLKPKQAVRAATTVAGTLATSFEAGDAIDGVTLVAGDRILIKDQAAPAENGIYVVQASGAPVRASDYNAVSEIPGSYTVAQEGTANQGTLFVTTSSPATLDTDPIVFVARAVQTYSGGDMITLSGSTFSVDLATVSGLESSNPGNAAGQLRVKVEASNPTLQIDGSNQLGVKLDGSRAITTGASGIGIKLETSNPSLQISTNELGAKLDAAGSIVSGSNGLKVQLEASNPSLQISSNEIGLKMDAAGALQKVSGGVQVKVDAATVKINGSNQLESLKQHEEEITLTGTDITNQYVDLAKAVWGASASDNSVILFVEGGGKQRKAVDYTVSLTGGAGGVTRITFAGGLATGGASELVATDILTIAYSFLT